MRYKGLYLFVILSSLYYHVMAQCTVSTEMNANGTISKITEADVLYYNEKSTILSQVKFDGIEYFVVLVVKPFTNKEMESKSMEILLDNETTLVLDFYDSYSIERDTSINALFRINKKYLDTIATHDINSIRVNTNEGPKNFILKLHKDLLKNQLNCLMGDGKKEE